MKILTRRFKATVKLQNGDKELVLGEPIENTEVTDMAPFKDPIQNVNHVASENQKVMAIILKAMPLDKEFEITQHFLIE